MRSKRKKNERKEKNCGRGIREGEDRSRKATCKRVSCPLNFFHITRLLADVCCNPVNKDISSRFVLIKYRDLYEIGHFLTMTTFD